MLVSGRVQGVFYRQTAARRAAELGVTGWVANLPDGRVEALFEGAREGVEALIGWCGSGPAGARVDGVEVRWVPPEGTSGFAIR